MSNESPEITTTTSNQPGNVNVNVSVRNSSGDAETSSRITNAFNNRWVLSAYGLGLAACLVDLLIRHI